MQIGRPKLNDTSPDEHGNKLYHAAWEMSSKRGDEVSQQLIRSVFRFDAIRRLSPSGACAFGHAEGQAVFVCFFLECDAHSGLSGHLGRLDTECTKTNKRDKRPSSPA